MSLCAQFYTKLRGNRPQPSALNDDGIGASSSKMESVCPMDMGQRAFAVNDEVTLADDDDTADGSGDEKAEDDGEEKDLF